MYLLPFKQKTKAQAIFLIPFTLAHHANGGLLVCPFVDKEQTEVICLPTD
jgi:hypothetical protein